ELVLIDTAPPSSSEVTAETTVQVRVRYNVRNFQPDTYRLEAMFESTQAGSTVGVPTTKPSVARAPLTSASGEMTLDVPLARLLAQSNVAKPLRMWVFLLRKTGERTSRPVVRTPTVVFNVK